jgi:Xaa-Pro aminopeptidase
MFKKDIYISRRDRLRNQIKDGLVLFLGNEESSMNYPGNTFHYRQDSNFLYFFGIDLAGMVGVIDIDNDKDYIFGDDYSMDDIIWMGPQPSVKEQASNIGIKNTLSLNKLSAVLKEADAKGKKIHILPFYRGESKIQFCDLLDIHHLKADEYISNELIKAVVNIRSIKDSYEVEELIKAAAIGYKMHTTAMKMAKPGVYEQEIAGAIEGIALAHGSMLSFPIILSQHGETLHNHYHGNMLEKGKLMLTDAGAETMMHYASDNTRTVPVGGKFSTKQKDIYNIVLDANNHSSGITKPGISYFDVHMDAATRIAMGLKNLGIMKGDPEEAARIGAYALFMPHGLGHMMGLDVHDMEGLGEDNVGYDDEIKRSEIFGLSGLRLGRKLQEGFVLTNEPGIYFIPALIDKWRSEKKFSDFINYDKVEEYKNFGGIRLEDDLLVTKTGNELIGKRIPITVDEIEDTMK